MSWARDEWKLDLPTTALRKISELENDAENLRKSKQQQQFQLESVSTSLQKQKQLNAEEKTANSNLRREIQELARKCSDMESQEEKTQVDLKAKDNKIGLLEEQLRKAKAKLKDEEDKNSEALSQIDSQKLAVEAKENEIGELSEELGRAKDAKAQAIKDLEVSKEKVDQLYKENEALRDQLRQRDELLTSHSRNQSIQSIDNEAEPTTDTADTVTADAVSSAFLEILKRENNALISDNEELKAQVEHLKSMLREKEKELERVMEKLAASHAECEKTKATLKAREKEIAKLEEKLDRTEGELRNTYNKVEVLQEKSKELHEGIMNEKRNTEITREKIAALSSALEDSKNKIKTLETDLTQRSNQVKSKRDRIETLEEENVQLTQELDSVKRQNNAATESYLSTMKALREKDNRIQELNEDYKEKKNQLKIQGEKVEILTSENSRLKEELDRAEEKFADTERSYRRVSKALDDCRKKFQDIDIGQDLWAKEAGVGQEEIGREDVQDDGSGKQKLGKTKTTKCSNCDYLKEKLREEQNDYEQKIRELEACIRDLMAEKEALKRKMAKERRDSEEFTSRVQQMVQQLETEQRGNKTESESESSSEQAREKDVFVNMVNSFFTENEGLKEHAQKCLGDLQQLEQYFKGCSNGAKDVISHAHAFETVAKRMALLKSLLESVLNEFARPLNDEASDAEGIEDSPQEASIKPELSWDDYEKEVAFKTFKGGVEDILQLLEKDKKRSEKKMEELHEVKRAHMALKKVRKRSRREIERALEESEIEDPDPGDDTQKGSLHINTRIDGEELVEVIKQLLDQNREEIEYKMSGYFTNLENTIKQERAQPVLLSEGRREKFGGENIKDAIDGKYAIGELDLVKKKLTDVQKSIKHLIGSLAEIEREKKTVESKMDLLNGELDRKESEYEAINEDLKRVTKSASEHEISFRNRLGALSSEKEQINSELRRVVGTLKERELELVEKSQQLKQVQSAFKDKERALKNKLDSLEQENNELWLDYKGADKRAEIKEKEFKELSERLKKSQGYIHSVFSSLTNMDDELQKARDIEAFSEQD